MLLHIESPQDDTRELLELSSEYGKVSRQNINIQKSLHFYTLSMNFRKKSGKNSFYNNIKKNTIPRNKPFKEIKNLTQKTITH